MNMGLIMTALLAAAPSVEFKTTTLATVSEEVDYFLNEPLSMDTDDQGNIYLADGGAQVIFCWNQQGEFSRALGKPGQGPGEFVFRRRRSAQAFVAFMNGKLFIYDGGKRKVLIFDREGQFIKEFGFSTQRGAVRSFFVTGDEHFLLHRTRRGSEGGVSEVLLLDAEGQIKHTYRSEEENTFSRRGSSRETATFTIRVFNPTLTASFNPLSGELLIGFTGEPSFERYELSGNKRVISVPLVREEVIQTDKDEFLEQNAPTGRRRVTYEFPEEKPYYDRVLPVGDRGYLIYSESPYYHRIKGRLLDRKGAVLGTFQMECGENGGLLAAKGRIFRAKLGEDDELMIEEIEPLFGSL